MRFSTCRLLLCTYLFVLFSSLMPICQSAFFLNSLLSYQCFKFSSRSPKNGHCAQVQPFLSNGLLPCQLFSTIFARHTHWNININYSLAFTPERTKFQSLHVNRLYPFARVKNAILCLALSVH